MTAQPTRTRPAGGWISPPSSQEREPAVAAGLPVRAEDGGAIAVFQAHDFAARRRRFPVRLLSFVIIVLVPTTLAAVYYFVIAADQYVAEFRFALRTVEPVRAEVGGIFQGSVAPSPVGVDSYAVVQYLASRDVVDDLGHDRLLLLQLRQQRVQPACRQHPVARQYAQVALPGILWEVTDSALALDRARIRLGLTREDPHRGRLASAVAADQADPVPRLHAECRSRRGQQDPRAGADLQVRCGDHGNAPLAIRDRR